MTDCNLQILLLTNTLESRNNSIAFLIGIIIGCILIFLYIKDEI